MPNFPQYALHASAEISNRVFATVEKTGVVRPLGDDTDFDRYLMVIIDCASTPPAEITGLLPRLEEAFAANTAILLLDPTADHKRAFAALIGFRNELASAAFVALPTKDLLGRDHYRIIEQAYPIHAESTSGSTATQNHLKGELTIDDGLDETVTEPQGDLDAESTLPFSRALHEALETIFRGEVVRSTGNTPPANAPYKLWSYTINHTLRSSGGGAASDGFKPSTGNLVLSGTSEIGVYLDNIHENGAFFFAKIITSALASPHMNSNSGANRGWLLGGIKFEGSNPTNLSHVSSSPANVAGQTTYTASSGFTVGVAAGTDGAKANFSYTESNSATKTIADWAILQTSTDAWTFEQAEPFDGYTPVRNVFDPSIKGGEIIPFPSITTGGLTIETQSVWRTDGLLTGVQQFPISWGSSNYFIHMITTGKNWNAKAWHSLPGASDVWSIDYSKLTWTGPR